MSLQTDALFALLSFVEKGHFFDESGQRGMKEGLSSDLLTQMHVSSDPKNTTRRPIIRKTLANPHPQPYLTLIRNTS
jgi:hypothetical protein